MRAIKLSLISMLFVLGATAQEQYQYDLSNEKAYTPTVYANSDTTCCTNKADNVKAMATADYHNTHRYGYDQVEKPQFIFAEKENRFSFAVGGLIKLISSYDFGGISNAADFVPSSISVPRSYDARQQIAMDASTSTLYLKAIANTKALGRVIIYIDTDFRGGAANEYKPRLKYAYISFLGLTLGRDVTTFSDLSAAPATVDFAGPNAYAFNYATLIRYERTLCHDRFRVGASLELPNLSATYGENFNPIPQRMPNVPLYMQYMWDENKSSHIRTSAIFRELYAYNTLKEHDTSLLGWGVQLSGNIKCTDWMRFMFNGVYGEGITPYIQDITGSGLDFTPNPSNPAQLQTTPMYGMQGAIQVNPTSRLQTSAGVSMVQVEKKNGYEQAFPYKRGVYAFGNVFYKLTPRCTVAGEYLYGSRENMDNQKGDANRINLMLQYNF